MASKVCLIIGGTGGLGQACAELIATKGYVVVVQGRNKVKGEEVVTSIKSKGGEAEFIACDLNSEPEIRKLHRTVVDKYGRLDAAINSAGIAADLVAVANVSVEHFQHVMNINLTAVLICVQEQIRIMLSQQPQGGHIVNLSSIFGAQGCPWNSVYCMSKFAVNGLTKAAALEVANQGIYINSIATGITPTGFVEVMADPKVLESDNGAVGKVLEAVPGHYPVERYGTPDATAKAAAYLLECDWVTGTVLDVDGGWSNGKAMPVGVKCQQSVELGLGDRHMMDEDEVDDAGKSVPLGAKCQEETYCGLYYASA